MTNNPTKIDYEKVYKDGMKVTVENGWSIIYDSKGKEITRSLTKYYFNNPYGYNVSSYKEMADTLWEFWKDFKEE